MHSSFVPLVYIFLLHGKYLANDLMYIHTITSAPHVDSAMTSSITNTIKPSCYCSEMGLTIDVYLYDHILLSCYCSELGV